MQSHVSCRYNTAEASKTKLTISLTVLGMLLAQIKLSVLSFCLLIIENDLSADFAAHLICRNFSWSQLFI